MTAWSWLLGHTDGLVAAVPDSMLPQLWVAAWYVTMLVLAGAALLVPLLRRGSSDATPPEIAGSAALLVRGAALGGALLLLCRVGLLMAGEDSTAVMIRLTSPAVTSALMGVLVLLIVRRLWRDTTAAPHWQTAAGFGGAVAAAWLVAGGSHGGNPSAVTSMVGPVVLLHLASLLLWVGPLLALGVLTLARRRSTAAARAELASLGVRAIRPLAGWGFGVAVASGAWLAIATGRLDDGLANAAPLIIKAAVIAVVVVPLAVSNHRHGDRSDGRARPGRALVGARAEALALVGVVAIASFLTPAAGPDEAEHAHETVACDGQGGPGCVRDELAALLVAQGPDAAVTHAVALAEAAGLDCHQLVHTLGRDAVEELGSVAAALAGPLPGACAGGYAHGVVEQGVAHVLDVNGTTAALASLCAPVADPAYSLDHYNCVHGLGHGLLRNGGDLFAALPLCHTLGDEWSVQSCLSGTFMENVLASQAGELGAAWRVDDLQYPCNAVRPMEAPACWSIQTSLVLWQLEGDIAASFDICDGLDARLVDGCYASMGRDISGRTGRVPAAMDEQCRMGTAAHQDACYWGAASDAVYHDPETTIAAALCALAPASARERCLSGAGVDAAG